MDTTIFRTGGFSQVRIHQDPVSLDTLASIMDGYLPGDISVLVDTARYEIPVHCPSILNGVDILGMHTPVSCMGGYCQVWIHQYPEW
jgi:deoxyhypusine synthase